MYVFIKCIGTKTLNENCLYLFGKLIFINIFTKYCTNTFGLYIVFIGRTKSQQFDRVPLVNNLFNKQD